MMNFELPGIKRTTTAAAFAASLAAAVPSAAEDLVITEIIPDTMPAAPTLTLVEAEGNHEASVDIYCTLTSPHCFNFFEKFYPQLKDYAAQETNININFRDVYFERYALWGRLLAGCDQEQENAITLALLGDQSWAQSDTSDIYAERFEIAENLKAKGENIGLAEEDISACLSDGDRAQSYVATYQKAAKHDGIIGVPTLVFDNGEQRLKIEGANGTDPETVIEVFEDFMAGDLSFELAQ